MEIVNWNLAPKDATFFAAGFFRRKGEAWFFDESGITGTWNAHSAPMALLSTTDDYCERPQQWPETDERITAIAQNGGTGEHYAQSAAPQANKYDRTIIGKYGTGKCTVDVYRVLNAFPTGSPEIDHALKKLLAAGKRGAKDELQDLREAVQSIESRIDYLTELGA